ncbi:MULTISPECIES: DUF2510 domain-containing protein [Gordonia]|uniref:DUF2510 domain-containing protein n=1 Tax=Gordonia TaxID=2053 RepID=UPI0025C4D1EA|nr:DUF2510 domain-containing protein [Gordonia sp. UBA5067]
MVPGTPEVRRPATTAGAPDYTLGQPSGRPRGATPPPPPPSVPAGWYPDADNPALQRYWDGTQWTEHTAPAGHPV